MNGEKIIGEYILEWVGQQQVPLPIGSEILDVHAIGEEIILFFTYNEGETHTTGITIEMYGTKQTLFPVPKEDHLPFPQQRKYIGTVFSGGVIWHIFTLT